LDHSLAEFVAACRRGEVRPDSLFDPSRLPATIAQARTMALLNAEFASSFRRWQAETFRERLRENFPLMQ
jgi:hypothetical protein